MERAPNVSERRGRELERPVEQRHAAFANHDHPRGEAHRLPPAEADVIRGLAGGAVVLACSVVAAPVAAADANAGAALVQANGCAGCHGATLRGGIGPNLAGIEARL